MPNFCKVCQHQDRAVIERRLAEGSISKTTAAKIVGCDTASIYRHMNNHMIPEIREAMKTNVETAHALNAIDALLSQYEIVQDFLKEAIAGRKVSEVAAMLKEGRKHIELSARLTGQLNGPSTQVNLLLNPEFVQLKEIIFDSLGPTERAKLSIKLNELADQADADKDQKVEVDEVEVSSE
jgi:hypothetical protein